MLFISLLKLLHICRPHYASLITIGQLLVDYRRAKPQERKVYFQKEVEFNEHRHILVSGRNSEIPPEERKLPKHIVFSDGTVYMLLKSTSTRILDTKEHSDDHHQMYADMFLYIPWDSEEEFLGTAKNSIDDCQAKWNEFGHEALDIKNQIREKVKASLIM